MDRNDAAFVANVLDGRIAGAREDLERHAASFSVALLAASAIIRDGADGWAPAEVAADELAAIAKGGGSVCDQPVPELLAPFVEAMRKLAGEPAPKPNRRSRLALIAQQSRGRRKIIRASDLLRVGQAPIVVN